LRQVFILYEFNDSVRSLIHALKYRNKTLPGQILGEMLGNRISAASFVPSIIVPVPLHSARRRERGYNQSEVIARAVGHVLGCQVHKSVLARVRATPSQTQLGAGERQSNVCGAFRVCKPEAIQGKKVLLVDDVITTGATVDACAQAMMDAGAKEVVACAVAHPQMDEADHIFVAVDLQP
jgi:ComF family protein